LINQEGEGLRVIAVWGTSGDLGQASIISEAYENPDIKNKFPWQASVRVLHPFNPNDFIQSLVMQFRSAVGVDVLLETEKTGKELAEEFIGYINENSYLILLNDLSIFEVWNGIKACLSLRKNSSILSATFIFVGLWEADENHLPKPMKLHIFSTTWSEPKKQILYFHRLNRCRQK
jgi:hypothetical protein